MYCFLVVVVDEVVRGGNPDRIGGRLEILRSKKCILMAPKVKLEVSKQNFVSTATKI